MTKTLSIVLSLCALVLTGALLFVFWKLSAALDTTRQAAWNVSALAWNSQPTVQHVNEATDVWAKSSQKQADAADALLRDLRVMSWHLDRSFLKLDTVLDTSNEQIKHVGPLLDSVRKSSDAIPGTLDHVDRAADASTGAINASQRVVDDFHVRLTDKRIDALLDSFRGVADNANGISSNFRVVTDKARQDYLTPKTPWRRVGGAIWDAYSIAGWAARH